MIGPRLAVGLIVAAGIAVAGAATGMRSQSGGGAAGAGEPALIGLEAAAERVGLVTVTAPGGQWSARRDGDLWRLDTLADYPAEDGVITAFVDQLARLTRRAPRTDRPALYPILGTEDPGSAEAQSIGVVMADEAGETISGVILGGRQRSGIWQGQPGRYVRTDGEARTWLADGPLAVPASALDWVETTLMALDGPRVRRVVLQPDTPDALVLERPAPDARITAADPGETVDENAAARLVRAFRDVRLVEIRPGAAFDGVEPSHRIVVSTFDGVGVSAAVYGEGEDLWVTFAARFAPRPDDIPDEERPELGLLSTEAASAQVSAIRRAVDGYAFRVPRFVTSRLTAPIRQEPAPQTEVETAPDGAADAVDDNEPDAAPPTRPD